MVRCAQCGKDLRLGAGFCSQCGTAVKSVDKKTSFKKETESDANPRKSVSPTKQFTPSGFKNSGKPANRHSLIIKALIKGLSKSLILSALLIGPGFVLLTLGFKFLGMVGLFFGSFCLMARTYRRPWRLTLLSCLIPPPGGIHFLPDAAGPVCGCRIALAYDCRCGRYRGIAGLVAWPVPQGFS